VILVSRFLAEARLASDLDSVAREFVEAYAHQRSRLAALNAAETTSGEKQNIELIERLAGDFNRSFDNRSAVSRRSVSVTVQPALSSFSTAVNLLVIFP
jgi:hypothetical protein